VHLAKAQPKVIEMKSERTDNGYDIYAMNRGYCSYLISFKFKNVRNLSGAPSVNMEFELPVGRHKLLSLRTIHSDQSSNYNYSYSYRKGRKMKKLQETFTYLLPIKHGTRTQVDHMSYIGDNYGTQKESDKPVDFYGLTFSTNSGDTIYAVRSGMVVEVVDQKAGRNTNLSFSNEVNTVEIFHKDGTFALYKLFQKDGIFVKPGQKVIAGMPIGIIGGDQFLRGSHLRFYLYYAHKDQRTAFVKPTFASKERTGLIDDKMTVTSLHTEAVITQEMNKQQRKKWKKKLSQL
ncbi:MAG: M23 family metallopeptidase, partial [Bacteroidota bacterium]